MTKEEYIYQLERAAREMKDNAEYPAELQEAIDKWNKLVDMRKAYNVSMQEIVNIRDN